MRLARREALLLGAVALGAAAAGSLIGVLALQARSGAAELLAAPFTDLSGKPRRLLEWQGRVVTCNFWATWCAPCLEEMPMFSAAQQHYAEKGAVFVGIGIDHAAKIAEFTAKLKISFPILVADSSAIDLVRRLGNPAGALPYTVFLDRSGAIVHRKLGALNRLELDQILAGLVR